MIKVTFFPFQPFIALDMSDKKLSFAEVLHKNRSLVLAILGVPVLGMAIAAGLIIYKKPDNMIVVLGVILFVAIQYVMTMFFWSKRVEKLANKTPADEPVTLEKMPVDIVTIDSDVLAPEEKRVLPINNDKES
jgi:c-di-AMP phosphodiesterase-like protein